MFLNPLFKHRYQADLVAPPGGGVGGGRLKSEMLSLERTSKYVNNTSVTV